MSGRRPADVIPELGLRLARTPDGLQGAFEVVPELCVPATDHLRTSVMVLWADLMCGLLKCFAITPRVPVTLELAVEMFGSAPLGSTVDLYGRVTKAGSAVTHAEVEATVDGRPVGLGSASFMAARDPDLALPDDLVSLADFGDDGRRPTTPYAERVGCERLRPGVATMPRTPETANASHTINGGIVALAVEEAVLSAEPDSVLESMALRYLRPARVGPAVAVATAFGDLWRVEVRDAGAGDRTCVLGTVRTRRP